MVPGCNLVGNASRTAGKAESFARKHGVPRYHDSYEELVRRDDIDAIYVATTHNFHYECVKLALENGKHVLCEKPFMVNSREAAEMIALARSKHLFMMEGMWTRFLPAVIQLRKWLSEGRIGKVQRLHADFGFRVSDDPKGRLLNRDLAGGALLDAGIYPLSFARMVMGARPATIQAVGHIGPTGVDEQSVYLFRYDDGSLAVLSSAVRTALDSRAVLFGTEGRIVVPSRFLTADAVELQIPDKEVIRKIHPYIDQEGFKYELAAVDECIYNGETECSVMPLDETLELSQTIDEIKRQLGLTYANDELRPV